MSPRRAGGCVADTPAALPERMQAWLDWLATQRRVSPLTLTAYRAGLQALLRLAEARPPEELQPADIRRFVARLHGERGVERGRGLVAQPAQHPGAAPCCGLGSVEHGTHLVQRMGRPHGARRAKRMAQAGTGRIMRVGKVDQ